MSLFKELCDGRNFSAMLGCLRKKGTIKYVIINNYIIVYKQMRLESLERYINIELVIRKGERF